MFPLLLSVYIALVPLNTPYPQVLDCIVQAESGGHQFNTDGSPLVSRTHDYGFFQINQAWIPVAKNMGLDVINSEKDNITFAIWLMNTHGLSQWSTYKKCRDETDT